METVTPSMIAWYKKHLEMMSPAMFAQAGFPLFSDDGMRPPTLRQFDTLLATFQHIDRIIPEAYKKSDNPAPMELSAEDMLTCHKAPNIAHRMMSLMAHRYQEKTGRQLHEDWAGGHSFDYEYGPPSYAHFIRFICILKGQEDALEKGDFARINQTVSDVVAGQPDAKTAFMNLIEIPSGWKMPKYAPLTVGGHHTGTPLYTLSKREDEAHREHGYPLPEAIEKPFRHEEYLLHDETLHERLMQTVKSVPETSAEGIDTIIDGFAQIDLKKLQNPDFVNAALLMARLSQQTHMETNVHLPEHLWDTAFGRF